MTKHDRLLELAATGAEHLHATAIGLKIGHHGQCEKCSHQDCVLVRTVATVEAVAASLDEETPAQTRASLLADRNDARLLRELRAYLNTVTITSDTIGDIRRSLFLPWEGQWNGWVRDETASRENVASSALVERTPLERHREPIHRIRDH